MLSQVSGQKSIEGMFAAAQSPASASVYTLVARQVPRRAGPRLGLPSPSPTARPVSSNRHTQSPVSGFVCGIRFPVTIILLLALLFKFLAFGKLLPVCLLNSALTRAARKICSVSVMV